MSSDPVTSIDPAPSLTEASRRDRGASTRPSAIISPEISSASWICGLLQATDSFYPTGSYSHSFGLEGLIQAGVVHDRATLRDFIYLSALPALEHAELPIVALAWHALAERNWQRIGELSVLSSAMRAAREIREASERIGRQRAMLAATHHGGIARDYLERASAADWPFAATISVAVESCALGVPCVAAMSAYAYSATSGVLGAAMKLLRIGQNAAQSMLTEALAEAPKLISRAEQVSFDDIGWFNPWIDIAAARHETADARMFIS